jgi:hypothetical protein
MRVAIAIVVSTWAGWAQFKSAAPLVVAATTVTDSKGRYVDGLTLEDLILYDNKSATGNTDGVVVDLRFPSAGAKLRMDGSAPV